jgi:hypothetical protein
MSIFMSFRAQWLSILLSFEAIPHQHHTVAGLPRTSM